MDYQQLSACAGFEWDEGNSEKDRLKHKVGRSECEQIFFNRPLVVADDEKHSQEEMRYCALGQTDKGRRLFLVLTIRGSLIRVISDRDMNRAEKRIYHDKEDSEV